MGLVIYWTDFAIEELRNIFDFHLENASLKIANNIVSDIFEKVEILLDFPETGSIEAFLNDRHQGFRYLVSTNYKVIYWLNKEKNRIEIVDVFDTRQNPVKINRIK